MDVILHIYLLIWSHFGHTYVGDESFEYSSAYGRGKLIKIQNFTKTELLRTYFKALLSDSPEGLLKST
jgi:hypothetical protein